MSLYNILEKHAKEIALGKRNSIRLSFLGSDKEPLFEVCFIKKQENKNLICQIFGHKWKYTKTIKEKLNMLGDKVYKCKRCNKLKIEPPPPPDHPNCLCQIREK